MDGAYLIYDDPDRNMMTFDDAILVTRVIPMYHAGEIPDDDRGLLESGAYLHDLWMEKDEPASEDASDDEPPSDVDASDDEPPSDDETASVDTNEGYNLRNYILTVFGQILRCNPVFMSAYLTQALAFLK